MLTAYLIPLLALGVVMSPPSPLSPPLPPLLPLPPSPHLAVKDALPALLVLLLGHELVEQDTLLVC